MKRRESLAIVGVGLGVILAGGLVASALTPTTISGTPRPELRHEFSFVYPTVPTTTITPVTTTSMPPHRLPAPPAPAPAEPSAPPVVYYKNCTEAKAAGAAPILIGQPGYGTHLDRDRDGIACDK